MTTRPPHPRGPRRATVAAKRHRRPAFALVVAIGAFALAAAVIAWNITRLNAMNATTLSRLDVYSRHHEELAVADIARVWLFQMTKLGPPGANDDDDRSLRTLASTPEHDFEVLLPEGRLVRLWVGDGQGAVLANLGLADSVEQERTMLQTLARLPVDRPDLIRGAGPFEISLRAAEDAVLRAAAGDNTELFEGLRSIRDDTSAERGNIRSVLASGGVVVAGNDVVISMFTFDTVLWRVAAEVRDVASVGVDDATAAARGDVRWYQFLIELSENRQLVLERRRLTRDQFQTAIGRVNAGA